MVISTRHRPIVTVHKLHTPVRNYGMRKIEWDRVVQVRGVSAPKVKRLNRFIL